VRRLRFGFGSPRLKRLPADTYAYLLGVYLGDGCLMPVGSSWSLRIGLDEAYPGIIDSCCDAIEILRGGRRPKPRPASRGQRFVRIESMWRQRGCHFPQHGPGRKHTRRIELADWQRDIIDIAPEAFLRGLIHTDGWRGVNRVHVKGKDYEYPRYQFSNRSDNIRRLVTATCEKLGVARRQPRDPIPRVRCAARFGRHPRLVRRPEAVGQRSTERMRAEGLEPPRA
jgi:hypothetical protein